MGTSAETAMRYLAMAEALKPGEWVGTNAIERRLARKGYRVTRRTIQRDLMLLQDRLGLESRKARGSAYEWRRRPVADAGCATPPGGV